MIATTSAALIVAFGALTASASTLSAGSAKIINNCDYEVYLCNVPSSGGGYEQEDKTLRTNDTWNQTWTELSNGEGWSIKLSNSTSLANILQYEYTFHNDGTIWFDISCVNGDPWPNNWNLTADNGCVTKDTYYRYPTDDLYGMQSCAQDASITIELCAFDGGVDAPSSYASSAAVPAYTISSAATYSSSAVGSSAPSAYSSASSSPQTAAAPQYTEAQAVEQKQPTTASLTASPTASPTTLTTSAVVTNVAGVTVMEIDTAVVTEVVTQYGRHRRHEHHHAHQHQA